MSTAAVPQQQTPSADVPSRTTRRDSSPLWASVAISSMWLAVLLIGLFGSDIVSTTVGGTTSTVPVVTAVVPFVFVATIVVAVRGFGQRER